MEPKTVYRILSVVAWVAFVGLCIKAGALIFSFVISLIVNPAASADLYQGMNLSQLQAYSQMHYVVLCLLMIIIWILKANLFYYLIQLTAKINITHPFSEEVSALIGKMSALALQIGITGLLTTSYAKYLLKRVSFAFESASLDFLLLAAILYVIAFVFQRGLELQRENELTI